MSSDREKQRRLFNSECNKLAREHQGRLVKEVDSAGSDTDASVKATLKSAVAAMTTAYQRFPLLVSRTPQLQLTEGEARSKEVANITADVMDGLLASPIAQDEKKKKAKKKKKRKPPIPAWKLELQKRRGMVSDAVPAGEGAVATDDDGTISSKCKRTIAVAWNAGSRRLRWGLSGDMKRQRVHPSIWGKSLMSGRPRGTCAEFRVLNDALNEGDTATDMTLYVVDVLTCAPKERCRNCLYISRNAQVISDDLKFDGDMSKHARYQIQQTGAGAAAGTQAAETGEIGLRSGIETASTNATDTSRSVFTENLASAPASAPVRAPASNTVTHATSTVAISQDK
eukprot:g2631.t1